MLSRLTGLSALLLLTVSAGVAQATTTFDFAGQGFVCTYTGSGSGQSCTDTGFSGTVTLSVSSLSPLSLSTSFQVDWSVGTYVSAHVPGESSFGTGGIVKNDELPGPTDTLQSWFQSQRVDLHPITHQQTGFTSNYSFLQRIGDSTWLSSSDFIETAGLAPGAGATNRISFEDFSVDIATQQYSGFYGEVNLDSLVARGVPEPGPLALSALAAIALAGRCIGARRQRRG